MNEFELSTVSLDDLLEELGKRFKSVVVSGVEDTLADDKDHFYFNFMGGRIECLGLANWAVDRMKHHLELEATETEEDECK